MVMLNGRCVRSPALVDQNDERLVVAWVGISGGKPTGYTSQLNVNYSTDGVTWNDDTKYTFPHDNTRLAPALAYDSTTNTT